MEETKKLNDKIIASFREMFSIRKRIIENAKAGIPIDGIITDSLNSERPSCEKCGSSGYRYYQWIKDQQYSGKDFSFRSPVPCTCENYTLRQQSVLNVVSIKRMSVIILNDMVYPRKTFECFFQIISVLLKMQDAPYVSVMLWSLRGILTRFVSNTLFLFTGKCLNSQTS